MTSHTMKFTAIILLLLGSTVSRAQSLSPKLLDAAQLAMVGVDAFQTNQARERHVNFCEHNPIAQQFMGSRGALISYFAGQAALKIGTAHWLECHGHLKAARVFRMVSIADNAVAFTYSETHQR